MLAALKTGIVSYRTSDQSDVSVAVGPGFVELLEDRAVLITQNFCHKADVDPVRVRLDLKEADEALDHYDGDLGAPAYVELVARELWAAAQLELYGDPPPATVRTVYELGVNDALLSTDGESVNN
jgi:F-type H+-transporting ATPase subunit epsilon